jgi:hypothetical protein
VSVQTTAYVLVGAVTVLVLWDVWAIGVLPLGGSISEHIGRAAKEFPIVPAALGLLCGHVFAPQWGWLLWVHTTCQDNPAVVFLIFFLIGAVVWPLKP